jgi:hypothetical protein
MKKKLTLDLTWRECLRMWKGTAEEIRKGSTLDVDQLKREWLIGNGYKNNYPVYDCFFCDFAGLLYDVDFLGGKPCLSNCPARKIDRKFLCNNESYHYFYKPLKFYAKLVELNKKRLAKKRKSVKRKR